VQSTSVNRSCAPGCGRSCGRWPGIQAGQSSKSSIPVISATQVPSRTWPSRHRPTSTRPSATVPTHSRRKPEATPARPDPIDDFALGRYA
jgi:hypothetical protein